MMRKKICFCTTIGTTINAFLVDLSMYLVEHENYDVTWFSADDERLHQYLGEHIHFVPINMKRGLSLDGPLVIWKMYQIFKRDKFDIVQYATPNASLYASIAAKMAGVKNRLYTHWGSRYMGYDGGLGHWIFKKLEKITCRNSTFIETESFSLREYSIKDGLYSKEKSSVIWNGSACGVKLECYDWNRREEWRAKVRAKYNIPEDAVVFGWCGRITRDKGHNELFEAFRQLNKKNKKARLLVVGRYDNADTINPELLAWAQNCKEVVFTGLVPNNQVQEMYSAMDVFCSLSYREGFGLVVIEAAAMGLPGIVTDVPGQFDTIVKDKTGILVPAKEVKPVVKAMEFYIENPEKMSLMGANARRNVEDKYDQQILFGFLAKQRNELIKRT